MGAGFDTHPHHDMEIVTWVVEGSLVHRDSTGRRGIVHPGLAQRMSAGTGVLHSERNDAHRLEPDRPREPVRFVQMWVPPDTRGRTPAYAQRDLRGELAGGGLVPVASGLARHAGAGAVPLDNGSAALHAARLPPGGSVQLPAAPYLHLFVVRGAVVLDGAGALAEADAARLTAAGVRTVTATEPAEVLVWEMHASATG